MSTSHRIRSLIVGLFVGIGGGICAIAGVVSLVGSTEFQSTIIGLVAILFGLALIGSGLWIMILGLPFQLPSNMKNEAPDSPKLPSAKNLKWPDNYQERIETIIGAKYDNTNHVYFLGFDFETVSEAKNYITKIQIMQKQLRQVKSEINNKIKVVKKQQLPKARKKDGALLNLASLMSDISTGHKVTDYQFVVLNIEKLLDACEKQKIEIEVWIEQQKSTVKGESFVRERISDDVQVFVWNRDGGKCVKCGSREKLEFDHIIPVSKGGSNTARNIQLLCETCNRKKSSGIGG